MKGKRILLASMILSMACGPKGEYRLDGTYNDLPGRIWGTEQQRHVALYDGDAGLSAHDCDGIAGFERIDATGVPAESPLQDLFSREELENAYARIAEQNER